MLHIVIKPGFSLLLHSPIARFFPSRLIFQLPTLFFLHAKCRIEPALLPKLVPFVIETEEEEWEDKGRF